MSWVPVAVPETCGSCLEYTVHVLMSDRIAAPGDATPAPPGPLEPGLGERWVVKWVVMVVASGHSVSPAG